MLNGVDEELNMCQRVPPFGIVNDPGPPQTLNANYAIFYVEQQQTALDFYAQFYNQKSFNITLHLLHLCMDQERRYGVTFKDANMKIGLVTFL